MANPGQLSITNNSSWWVVYYVPDNDNWWNCCDAPQKGFSVKVAPGKTSPPFTFVRTDGHGCNGEQGQFAMVPTLPNVDAAPQEFWFDSDGGLAVQGAAPNYVSQLSQSGPANYVWTVTPPGS